MSWGEIQKHTVGPVRERESVRLKRGKRVTVQASRHIQSEGIVPTKPASPTSKHLFFYCLYTSLPISSFTPFLSFSLSPPSFSVFFLHCPPLLLSHSQRLCPQNYPDSSLKSSAWNHQITMEKERIQRGRRRALEGKNLFFTVSLVSLSPLHPIPHTFYIFLCLLLILWR